MTAQSYPVPRGSASVEPIMRLMGGVLADAVRIFQRNFEAQTATKRQEFRETRNWSFHGEVMDLSLLEMFAKRWTSIHVA